MIQYPFLQAWSKHTMTYNNTVQIKICGLKDPETAILCAESGAHSIGFVFYEKSPRHVSDSLARTIIKEIPVNITKTGVFVNETYDTIMSRVDYCGINAVQLHGNESPGLISRLKKQNLKVIKALFMKREPYLSEYRLFQPDAYLVECGKGILPGGNAETWNWKDTRPFGSRNPLILAGGLSPENIAAAIKLSEPDAVDVSSGVEYEPGLKDRNKIRLFIETVQKTNITKKTRSVF